MERALLAGKADGLDGLVDLFGETDEACRLFNPDPEHPRAPAIGKETKTHDPNGEGFQGAQFLQTFRHFAHLVVGNLAQKLECQVDALGLGPSRVG